MAYYVYILASKIGGTPYIGVTNDLVRRVFEHKSKFVRGFTKKYDVVKLAYYEQYDSAENAIQREKRRYFIVVAFVIAAVLTPPDVISQASLALPLMVLYEGSIIAVQLVEKKVAAAKAAATPPAAAPPPPEANPAE